MVAPIDVGLILAGLVLAFLGAALSVYTVTLTGFLVGAGAGYVVSPQLVGLIAVEGIVLTAVSVLLVGAVGGVLAYVGLSFAVMGLGAIVGAFLGRYAIGPFYGDGTLLLIGATLAGLAIGAVLGLVLTRTTLVFVTAFVGSALATRSLTLGELRTARELLSVDPLLFEFSPLFLAVLVLAILSQFGLFRFGYVTKLVGVLPGARRWTASDD